MKSTIFFATVFLSSTMTFAQETKSVFDVGVSIGYNHRSYYYLTKDEWNRLTPGHSNLGDTDTSMTEYSNPGFVSGAPIIEVSAFKSLKIAGFEKRGLIPMIMLTAGNGNSYYSSLSWTKETRFRYDTLTSSHSGQQYFIDSTVRYFAEKAYSANTGSASLSFVLQTNREKRFSYLFGLGVYGAFGKGETAFSEQYERSAQRSDDSTFSYYYGPSSYPYYPTSMWSMETSEGPAIWQFGAKVPLGIDFVIGNSDRKFWHRCVVGIQASLNYRRTVIVDYEKFSTFNYSLSGAIKYRFGN